LSDSQVQQLLEQLNRIGVVDCTENGHWVLTRDLNTLTLEELYEACQLRIPTSDVPLPHDDDRLGQAVLAAMDALRLPLREHLQRNLASIYFPDLRS